MDNGWREAIRGLSGPQQDISKEIMRRIESLERDAGRYRKLRKWAKATSDIANGGALCFILDIDWGAIKDGDDADMLDAAIDAEP